MQQRVNLGLPIPGLVFSRVIDGCQHAAQAKCKETKSRGGAAEDGYKSTISTTTPFPPFDYDYYYYYDEDYVDPALENEVASLSGNAVVDEE